MRQVAWCLMVLVCLVSVQAKEAPNVAEDPKLEARVIALSSELRCLVCQNQTIADSHAELAIDLKNQVREQMREGKSDDEIRAYMVARYGDFVLYSPPVKPTTMLLWIGPFALLALGAVGMLFYVRRRRARPAATDMSETERERAHALLQGNTAPSRD
jgi:cytochrome c-type biogenesis protein CcmH